MMDFKGRKVLVYGAGKSGIGAADLLTAAGAHPVLYDENASKGTEEILASLKDGKNAGAVTGELTDELIASCDCVVLSPGVPCDGTNVLRMKRAGLPVLGELELGYLTGAGTVLAVTGTNGKTTTTSLLGEIMKAYTDPVFVVGNIGNAYTASSLMMTDDAFVVAEVSSFQLETITEFHPHVSSILNITEDHLNRHHTMEEYIRVKELITKNQDKTDTCVLNYEDPVLREFAGKCPADVFFFSSEHTLKDGIFLDGGRIVMRRDGKEIFLFNTGELLLIGVHNYENVMAAAAMAYSAGVPAEVIRQVCRSFKSVPHRIEYIDEKNGVIWYNDSKGTNPDAAVKGILAMSRPTYLIAGGYDKKSDYRGWIRSFGERVKKLVLEGATRFDIRDAALECGFPEEDIVIVETMKEAMDYCRDHASSGDAVLLSPACASWGEFPNYEVRGDTFREYVRKEI